MTPYFIFMIGMLVGGITTAIMIAFRRRSELAGYLRFYDSEPGEDPIMTAELTESVNDIYKRKYVTFGVSHK